MTDLSHRFKFTKADEFFGRTMPKLDWTVEGLIEQGTFVVLGGEPKTSKTWAILEIAISVATGRPAFNDPSFACEKPRPVFMFLLEDGEYNVQARMEALATSKGMFTADLKKMPLYLRCRKPVCIDEDVGDIIDHIKNWSEENSDMIRIDRNRPAKKRTPQRRERQRGDEKGNGRMSKDKR